MMRVDIVPVRSGGDDQIQGHQVKGPIQAILEVSTDSITLLDVQGEKYASLFK